MTPEFSNFLNDIQSINRCDYTGFVLICGDERRATELQRQIQNDFHINAITDVDNNEFYYVIPFQTPDDKTLSKFIHNGYSWDRDQKFSQYTITLYSDKYSDQIHNLLIAHGYNVTRVPNNMQFVVRCLDNSEHNDEIQRLNQELTGVQKSQPMSMDKYFNKVLFNGAVENTEYRNTRKQEFTINEFEQKRDLIIREMLYRYFKNRIRPYLKTMTFLRKFDANKLDKKLNQNINLIREFLYAVCEKYVDMQNINAIRTKHNINIRFDHLTGCNDYKDFSKTVKLAHKWWNDTANRNREQAMTKKQSMTEAYKVMDCENGYYFVMLYGSDALQFEGEHMHHCLKNKYWATAIKKTRTRIIFFA